MVELIAEAGRGAKLTAMASALGPKARESSPAPGTMVLKWWESTPGPAGTPSRATGRRGSVMVWEWRPRDTGFTKGNGLMASKEDTGPGSMLVVEQSMKGRGTTGFRMDMEQKHMLMEVSWYNDDILSQQAQTVEGPRFTPEIRHLWTHLALTKHKTLQKTFFLLFKDRISAVSDECDTSLAR